MIDPHMRAALADTLEAEGPKYVLQTLGRSWYLYCSQQDPSSLIVRPGPLSMSVMEQQSVVGLWACEYMSDSELRATTTLDRPGDLFLATHQRMAHPAGPGPHLRDYAAQKGTVGYCACGWSMPAACKFRLPTPKL